MPKYPLISFWDRDVHNVAIVWPPGMRRFSFTGPLEDQIERIRHLAPVRYPGPILPYHLTLGYQGLKRDVATYILTAQGYKIVTERPDAPRITWAPRRIIDGEWVTQG